MISKKIENIYRLGVKELWSLWRDPAMLFLIIFTFTVSVYTASTAQPETLNNAPIAIVDEDQSALSKRIISAFYPPHFSQPQMIDIQQMDEGMDAGQYTFALNIPANFQQDVISGKSPAIQLNVDATRMSQAFSGSGYIQQMVQLEVNEFVAGYRGTSSLPVELELRSRFNPFLEKSWFGGLNQIINNVTMLSIILTGAALIREREHGTVEHLLVMPVTVFEIMMAKIWSMGLVVLIASTCSLYFVVMGLMHIPIQGSFLLFTCGVALSLFATTSMGIFLATLAKSMPQFGLLLILILLPLQMLSGGMTPRESMPELVQNIMFFAPTTHFVELGQAILFRGAGLEVVWKPFLCLFFIGLALFLYSLKRFRETIHTMA